MNSINLNLILSDIITTIGLYIFIKKLCNIKVSRTKKLLFILFTFILYLISALSFNVLTKNIINLLIPILVSYLTIMNKDLNKAVYYNLLFIIINSILEVLITLVLLTIFKYSIDSYKSVNSSMLIFTIINTSLVCIVSMIPNIRKYINNLESKLLNSNLLKFYSEIFTILVILLVTNNFLNYEKNILYYVNFVMLIFVIMVSAIILYNKIAKDKIESQYKEMMEYVSKYEK